MFDPLPRLLLGLLTGIVFGFLLQKARVAKYRVIVGQLLLRDWTVMKVMVTAVIVGSVGMQLMVAAGAATLHIRPLAWAGVIGGAVLFGIGMAVLGYCPGTAVAGCGEGRRDAMVGVLGMFVGGLAFVGLYPFVQPLLGVLGDAGPATLPEATNISPWFWVAATAGAGVAAFWILDARRPRGHDQGAFDAHVHA